MFKMGSERNGVNKVADEILQKKRMEARRSKVNSPDIYIEFSKKERIAPLSGIKAPRVIKTSEFDPKGLPKSPYLNGDEMGKIQAYGIPSGSGLPLNKRYHDPSKKEVLDRNGNIIVKTVVTNVTSEDDLEKIDESSILEYMLSMHE
jgi:hypothetical protein